MAKYSKVIFLSFSVACVISIITCVIVDFAINRSITWSMYPILSVPFGWLILSPLVVKNHGITISLCAFTLFVLPFLLLLDKITPVASWFTPLGIPSAAVGVPTIWGIYLLFRFFKINAWYKSAVTVFLVGVIGNLLMDYYVNMYLNAGFITISTMISSAGCAVLAVVLFLQGRKRTKAKSVVQ